MLTNPTMSPVGCVSMHLTVEQLAAAFNNIGFVSANSKLVRSGYSPTGRPPAKRIIDISQIKVDAENDTEICRKET